MNIGKKQKMGKYKNAHHTNGINNRHQQTDIGTENIGQTLPMDDLK